MAQSDLIKDIAKFGLENNKEKLLESLRELVEHSKHTKKLNFALQLQSIIRDSLAKTSSISISKVGSDNFFSRVEDREISDLILEKLSSEYKFENLIAEKEVMVQLKGFVNEHKRAELLRSFELPIANKLLLHGPSGCGKTLASYVISGELEKLMVVVNLGAIVSSKLGETSKNMAKIFRKAAVEECIIFLDEFDSIGKIRDYDQDHGEMKRVVNTILQLFDYLPQNSVVIAATNQKEIIDNALLRRFDLSVKLDLPDTSSIKSLIDLIMRNGKFRFDDADQVLKIIKQAQGLSYFSIQKTLVAAIKHSVLHSADAQNISISPIISSSFWSDLIALEKKALS